MLNVKAVVAAFNQEKALVGAEPSDGTFSSTTTHPDEAQDSAYPEDPHHAQQRGRHGEVRHEVLHHDADDGGDHQHEVEQVPGRGEVVVPQPDDLDGGLCVGISK